MSGASVMLSGTTAVGSTSAEGRAATKAQSARHRKTLIISGMLYIEILSAGVAEPS